jgi:tetratricopeptide (TPR) repeat protein
MTNNKKVSQRLLTLEHKLERQSDAIKNIQKNVDNTFKNVDNTSKNVDNASKYQDLRQDVLKSQGNVITRWLSVIGIVLIILTTFAGYEVIVIQDNIDSSKELLKKSKSTLIEIQTHEKNAKKLVRKTESSARQVEKQIPRPGVKWSKKTKQEVEKFGTKFQKLRSKIEQENYKTAIDLWKYFIGHAYYENDKKNISIGYFNLGYSYSELKEYQEAIGAYKEVIKITSDFRAVFARKLVKIKPSDYKPIEPISDDYYADLFAKGNVSMTAYIDYSIVFGDYDNFKTYDNMGYAYGELKEYQKAIDAYKEAIKIKPNKHETYYNMGNAYRKLKEYQKAIDAYKAAIKIKPDYHKAKRSLDSVLKQLEEQ